MADRFPLIVNPVSKKIEELVSGDNLDLTGNGLIVSGGAGISGQYLKSTGIGLVWDNPGDVYLTATQTLTNKTLQNSIISGAVNTLTNIPNSSLVNSFITINGTQISLGDSVVTPDNNTTYSVSAEDGLTVSQKIIRLTGANPATTDDITLVAGTNVSLSRVNDSITINSSFTDTNTVTEIRGGASGSYVTGQVTIAASGSSAVSQSGNVITINSVDTDTITRIKGGLTGTLVTGDVNLLSGGATSISQSGNDITISSVNTITRLQSSTGGSLVSGDVTISAAGSSTVSQTGNTITITSTDTNTVTRLRGTATGTFESGDITLLGAGSTTITQAGGNITISSTDTDTTYQAGNGLNLIGTSFSIKNNANLLNNRIQKWDSTNSQLVNSTISDDGSTVTVSGNFTVTGTTTTIDATTLVIADSQIELRKGNNIVGADGGIQVNRTTNSSGTVLTYAALQWFESGGFWRVFNGTSGFRLVTETETQTLTNKTLTSPTLTNPSLGVASATSINNLKITTPTAEATLTIANLKTLTCNNTLTFSGTDGTTIGFGNGGTVIYATNKLSSLANTTSAELRGVISDETGTGVLVFNNSPTFVNAVSTSSTTINVFNATATTVNAFGAATSLNLGAAGTGTTTINNNLSVQKNTTLGLLSTDTITIQGTASITNADLNVRGITIGLGLGGNLLNSVFGFASGSNFTTGTQNTGVGYETLFFTNQGQFNTAVGYQAVKTASTGSGNVGVGRRAATATITGSRNVAIGQNALATSTTGNDNVCIGYFAGAGLTGSGNVIIGSAPNEDSTNPAFQPLSQSGNNQLVIASGSNYWIRGDSSYNTTVSSDFNVIGNLNVGGNLVIEGNTTTLNVNTLTVDDKNIELASVQPILGISGTLASNGVITNVNTNNLYVGMTVSKVSGTGAFGVNPKILSIDSDSQLTVTIDSGSFVAGSIVFDAGGANDDTADGGGITILGTTNKTINWTKGTSAFSISENIDLTSGKQYRIGNVLIASGTQIGPSTGSFSLGAGVTASSLTSVGTLTSLTVNGTTNLKQITETSVNNFNSSLAPSSGTLTVDTSAATVVLGDLNASVTTWAFTNVPTVNSKATTVTLIIDGDTAQTYGDACNVNGSAVSGGVKWAGGVAPDATNNYDILTFTIVRDGAGTINVFGSSTVNFS
jgi:hypothetical protein